MTDHDIREQAIPHMGGQSDEPVASFFVLRTPLLPAASFGEEMRALVERPEVREALFVASPSFDRALSAWLAKGRDAAPTEDAALTLVRYLARMAMRPTPFGLFAACSVGRIGDRTSLELAPTETYRRHTRLDAGYLALLAEAFERQTPLCDALRFTPSSGLYEAAGKLRHAEGKTSPESRERSYELVALARTPHLDATLARAALGARPADLAAALVADDPDVDLEEATSFVRSLVTSQVLVSDVAPTVTGAEAADAIADALRAAGAPGEGPLRILEQASGAMRALDGEPLGASPERYRAIAKELAALPAEVDIARAFQVDLHKPAPNATLGGPALRAIHEAIALTARIAWPMTSETMRRFRDAFVARYGPPQEGPLAARRMVPLVEALDDEVGLGFGTGTAGSSPLLEGLRFPSDAPATTPFGKRERHIVRRAIEVLRTGATEWRLSEADLEALAPAKPATLPDSFAFMGTLAAASSEALAAGDLRVVVETIGGPTAAMLLGRFCHGDPELHRAVEALVRAEEARRPDAVFAEIVHVPEGRLGNVLTRPALREYEIPYLGRSPLPPERQIAITDLHLVLDGGHFVLFSKRLGREVIPRLTNAHNFSASRFAIYRFLCALQHGRDRHGFGWDWDPLTDAPFLPRVSHGKVVLSLARWTLSKEEVAPLGKASERERLAIVEQLRRRRELPRWVVLADGDRTLPVDLDRPESVASFAALVARREGAVLTELFPAADELVAFGPEGRFAHQLIVPFVRPARIEPPATTPPATTARSDARRSFGPGSEWLALRLHGGVTSADDVLTDLVAPFVARSRKKLARWSFHREASPEPHVRVVLRGDPAHLTKLLPRLDEAAAPFLADGRLRRIAIDTYERDIERYGGDEGVELAESLFEADSDAALALLERLETAEERWHVLLRGCHDLLVDLGLDLAARIAVLERAQADLDVRADKPLEHALGVRFREQRRALGELLGATAESDHPLAPGIEVLSARSERLRPVIDGLHALEREGRLRVPLRDQAGRFLRMQIGRLVRSDVQEHALVLFDFLRRLYVSEAARRR